LSSEIDDNNNNKSNDDATSGSQVTRISPEINVDRQQRANDSSNNNNNKSGISTHTLSLFFYVCLCLSLFSSVTRTNDKECEGERTWNTERERRFI